MEILQVPLGAVYHAEQVIGQWVMSEQQAFWLLKAPAQEPGEEEGGIVELCVFGSEVILEISDGALD